jgi:hypothetical protein
MGVDAPWPPINTSATKEEREAERQGVGVAICRLVAVLQSDWLTHQQPQRGEVGKWGVTVTGDLLAATPSEQWEG